jgi:hypothetical protein
MKRYVFALLGLLISTLPLVHAADSNISVTVYNQNMALVRELRTIPVNQGIQEFSFDGVAAYIDPTSVRFDAEGINVLEQNFEYDLVSRNALMERYIGEMVDVQMENEMVRGKLLSTNGGLIIEDSDGEIRMIDQSAVLAVKFPEMPEGLILKPTLKWLLDSDKKGKVDSELNYITNNLSWEASYVAVVDENDTNLELTGWVQINNRSGARYEDAKLKLMAGDLNLAQSPRRNEIMYAAMDAMEAKGGFEEKEFFEYHLYTLPRKVTVADNQVKQISLIDPAKTPVEKEYIFNAGHGPNSKVDVTLTFKNEEKHGLGLPLPAGKVRIFKQDDDGSLQLIGEDRIDHTPRNETLKLKAGSAFDVVAERTRTDYDRLQRNQRDETYMVEIRNRKKEAITVTVNERFGGEWEILEESETGKKINANSYQWKIKLGADEVRKLTYKVRIK